MEMLKTEFALNSSALFLEHNIFIAGIKILLGTNSSAIIILKREEITKIWQKLKPWLV